MGEKTNNVQLGEGVLLIAVIISERWEKNQPVD